MWQSKILNFRSFTELYIRYVILRFIQRQKILLLLYILADTPLEDSSGTLMFSFKKIIRYLSMLRMSTNIYFFIDFLWFFLEGGGILPQNRYKPSQDLCVATLLRRTRTVQQLVRSFGTNIQTHKHTSCYFILRIYVVFIPD